MGYSMDTDSQGNPLHKNLVEKAMVESIVEPDAPQMRWIDVVETYKWDYEKDQ